MLPCLALLARLLVDMPIISTIGPMADCGCFGKPEDFAAFEEIVAAAHQRVPLRILGYVVMNNHWHFVVWPKRGQGEQMSPCFCWLMTAHAQSGMPITAPPAWATSIRAASSRFRSPATSTC